MASTIDLSDKFISIENLQSLIQFYQPIVQQADAHSNQPGDATARTQPPNSLSLAQAVLRSNDDASALLCLQKLMVMLSSSLTSINFSKSNVTGRVFFRAKERHIAAGEEAAKHRVFIEGRDARNKMIVRDDISGPDLYDFDNEKRRYHYVSTRFDETNNVFIRTYTEMDWLHLADVNMSFSDLSGHGLSALICSSSRTLTSLKINDCPTLDAAGFTTLVSLCRELRVLEFNNCRALTEQGIMHLAELPIEQIAQLELVSCRQEHLSIDFCMAFLHALEDKHFQGMFVFDSHPVRQLKGNANNPTINPATPSYTVSPSFQSPLRAQLTKHSASIIDLTYADITRETLQVLTREQRDFFTTRKADFLNSLNPKQQQAYAAIYGQKWPFTPPSAQLDPVYSLDLSHRHYINNTCLESILRQYGSHLYVLKLSHTFISSAGLSALSHAPNVRVLSLSSCHGLVDKNEANRAMLSVCKSMPELMELSISDSRLSGRMMSSHPFLSLFTYYAHGCPISSAAVRLLSESCCMSLSVLSLANCSFINSQSIYYITKLQRLIMLDISHCDGLRADDVRDLTHNWPASHCTLLRSVNVAGIQGITVEMCNQYGQILTNKKAESRSSRHGVSSPFLGEQTVEMACSSPSRSQSAANLSLSNVMNTAVSSHPYELVKPSSSQFSSATLQKINDQVRRATQIQPPFNEPVISDISEQPGGRYSSVSADDMQTDHSMSEPESAPVHLLPSPHVIIHPTKATSAPPPELGLQDTNYAFVPDSQIMSPIGMDGGFESRLDHHPPSLHINHSHSNSMHLTRNTSLPTRPSAPSPYPDTARILSRHQTLPHNFHNPNDSPHSPFNSTAANTPSHHSMSSINHHSLRNTPVNDRARFGTTPPNPPRYVAIDEQYCEDADGDIDLSNFSPALASYAPLPDQRTSH